MSAPSRWLEAVCLTTLDGARHAGFGREGQSMQWPRFTVRRLMVTIVFLAGLLAVITSWALRDPYEHHPYRTRLNKALDWARKGTDRFRPQEKSPEEECSLKIVALDFFWDNVHQEHSYESKTLSVSRTGDWVRGWHAPEFSIVEATGEFPAELVAAIASEVSSLPPSDTGIPFGVAVVILGYREHNEWTTRMYERSRLGPRVKALAGVVGFDLDLSMSKER